MLNPKKFLNFATANEINALFAYIDLKGKVPEWSIGAVSKTVVPLRVPRVRIPAFPPLKGCKFQMLAAFFMESQLWLSFALQDVIDRPCVCSGNIEWHCAANVIGRCSKFDFVKSFVCDPALDVAIERCKVISRNSHAQSFAFAGL